MRVELRRREGDGLDGGREQAIQAGGHALGGQLVDEAQDGGGRGVDQRAVLDGAEADEVEAAAGAAGGAAEQDRVRDVLRDDLARHVVVRVRRHAVVPAVGDPLGVGEREGAVGVPRGAEERADGRQVGRVRGPRRHQLVEEGRGAEEQQRQRPEVEVAVFGQRLLVALVAVQGHLVAAEVRVGGGVHHAEEGAVEGVVVAVGQEVVVAREGRVGFEFVVAIEPGF